MKGNTVWVSAISIDSYAPWTTVNGEPDGCRYGTNAPDGATPNRRAFRNTSTPACTRKRATSIPLIIITCGKGKGKVLGGEKKKEGGQSVTE